MRPSADARHVAEGDGRPATSDLPDWLLSPERYEPPRDRGEGFVQKSMLSLVGALSQLRLDGGEAFPLAPSAPLKLVGGLVLVLLTSLARNWAFVLVMLACVLVREALLPARALRRCVGVSFAAAGLTALVMLPAALLGQGQAALLVGSKVLVSTGVVMVVALTTPASQLTGALRSFGVPNGAIMVLDQTLRGIVDLGQVALEVLEALRLRSVGRNRDKGGSLGGVAGVTFLKGGEAARATADAMRCRGFEGEYPVLPRQGLRSRDVAWAAALVFVLALFCYLEAVV